MGIGLINPVAPFLITRYISDSNSAGIAMGWLASAYAICQLISAPGLGALSDRFGRRPILMICMLGSAVGYLIFGIGGALWVLFAGRIIDGITGGNLTVAFAYIADVTPPDERGKFFGWIGALSGIGFIIGPTLGGLLARFGNEVPLYFAAALTFANLIFGFFFMPESLPPEKRATSITVKGLNPFGVLRQVVAVPQLRRLLLALFLFNLPFSVLQTNIGLFVHDNLSWDIAMTGSLFALVGITDILVQGILLQRLLKSFGEARVATFGLVGELAGYLLITSVAFTKAPALMVIGTFTLAMGDGLLGPSVAGLLSRSADEQSQGQVQGGSQAVQALAHIGGPVLGGAVYDRHGYASPYLAGAGLVMVALGVIMSASREKRRNLKTVGL
jgi:DHA1 family tetracycline resistance protein-like MFS transporter